MSSANDFDYLLETWDIVNRRKKVRSLYDDPEANQQAEWEEFPAVCGMGSKYCDGRVMVDHFEGTYPSGLTVKGLNIRIYNPETETWSLLWLSNRQPPDLEPLVGKFENGEGRFESFIVTQDGRRVLVRYLLNQFTDKSFHWQQDFSLDGGETWESNWIMEHTRRH
jgi:hypothetical protein